MNRFPVIFMALANLFIAISLTALRTSGPAVPLSCSLRIFPCPQTAIEGGALDPDFEDVANAFRANFASGQELGAQLGMYVKGKKVVDMWGTNGVTPGYNNASLQRVFSCTKLMESLAIAICADKGYLRYDAKISEYWPNFAKHGKDNVTVEDLMRHSTGLHVFSEPVTRTMLRDYVDRGKTDDLSRLIEESPQRFHGGKRMGYHSLTRGFIIAEIVSRVDPKRRLIHKFIHEEILVPMELTADFQIPLRSRYEMSRVVKMVQASKLYLLANYIGPFLLGFEVIPQIKRIVNMYLWEAHSHPLFASGKVLDYAPQGFESVEPHNDAETYEFVFTSGSGLATGQALARFAQTMAAGGVTPSGQRILSEKGYEEATKCDVPEEEDYCLERRLTWTRAGFGCRVRSKEYPGGLTGWNGWGGSMCYWDRKTGFAMGYAMNQMGFIPLADPRTVPIVSAAVVALRLKS